MNREYPVLHSHTVELITKSGQSRYNIPDADFLREKTILGCFVRAQTDGNTRISKNGYELISLAALDCAFLYVEVDSKRVINDHPLSHFVHERGSNEPGNYTQMLLNRGFDPSTSVIRFTKPSTLADNKAIELTFIYALPKDICHV